MEAMEVEDQQLLEDVLEDLMDVQEELMEEVEMMLVEQVQLVVPCSPRFCWQECLVEENRWDQIQSSCTRDTPVLLSSGTHLADTEYRMCVDKEEPCCDDSTAPDTLNTPEDLQYPL